jgi:hypothetical protein
VRGVDKEEGNNKPRESGRRTGSRGSTRLRREKDEKEERVEGRERWEREDWKSA